MRNVRDRWTFLQNKGTLSASDIRYWKRILSQILKVGLEFEFNLPEASGTCKGDNMGCTCTKMDEDAECWKFCCNYEKCLVKNIAEKATCGNYSDGCPKSCIDCNNYAFKCIGMNCNLFESACLNCGTFEVKCTGCKQKFDENKNPDVIRDTVTKLLNPSNTYGVINASGVHSVVTDGSLLGNKGMEVVTIGRRPDYWTFFNMSKKIIDEAANRGAYVNERCSIHMHLLTAYYENLVGLEQDHSIPARISELERPIPEVVISNFHQLCRRYQNAITWMTMGLDDPNKLTRWEKYRVSILENSAAFIPMSSVSNQIQRQSGKAKYGWIHYRYSEFDENEDITRFHAEARVCDGLLSPSAVAAISCLFYALVIKAVEISRYGVLEIGDSDWFDQAKAIKKSLLNNMKDWGSDRFSDTSNLLRYQDVLIGQSYELIQQLKHILMNIGPAYSVLEKLAERPIAIRRVKGEDWAGIEESLSEQQEVENEIHRMVDEYVDLRIVNECSSEKEWLEELKNALLKDEGSDIKIEEDILMQNIEEYVCIKKNDGYLIWSEKLGSFVRI